jgi:hypothetical protein
MSLLKLWFIRNPVLVSYSICMRQGSSNLSGSQSALTCPCVCARARLGLREFNTSNGEILWDARNLKLVTATSLLLVVKLHHSENDEENSSSLLKMLPALLDGEHTSSQIVAMSLMLLRMHGFKMYPPSAVRFVHEIYRHDLASQTKADDLDQHNTMKLVFRRAMEFAEVSVTEFSVTKARQSLLLRRPS